MAIDIIEYRNFVNNLAKSHEQRMFLNSDEEHALAVFEKIFEISNSKVRIFAGNLCHHVGNEPKYIESLSDFIERNGVVNILLNKFNEDDVKSSNLFKRLAYYKSLGKNIIVKKTNAKPFITDDPEKKEVHFTIGDECSYRIEKDTENRAAECDLNNPIIAKDTATFFDQLFNRSDASEIDLTTLMGYAIK